jgi:uncharacterized membrane protein YtjA (UPF0391 family)
MLRLALLFLVIALVSALFGFGAVASLSFEAFKILFFVFLVLAVLFFVGNFLRGAPPRDIVTLSFSEGVLRDADRAPR